MRHPRVALLMKAACAVLVVAALIACGWAADNGALMAAAPFAGLILPLLLGAYPGADRLTAAGTPRGRVRRASVPPPATRPPARILDRGGALIASRMAERAPPAAVVA